MWVNPDLGIRWSSTARITVWASALWKCFFWVWEDAPPSTLSASSKKHVKKIDDFRVEVDADRAEEPPKVFTSIRIHFTVSGYELNENQVHRAIELSRTKFCGASIMMEKSGAEMKHSVDIIQL